MLFYYDIKNVAMEKTTKNNTKIITDRIPLKEALFGDKKFYRAVLAVTFPIIIQNLITNFVGLLDNIMVGRIGTEQMSGVAIVNQLMFVFNLCLFGAVSGAGIFGAQFFGKKDHDGVRYCFRFKILICLFVCLVGFAIFILLGDTLVGRFLHESDMEGDLEATLLFSQDYLKAMLWGLVPFAISQAYSGSLRDTGETFVPMVAGVVAVVTNLVLNYILIFGKFGCPEMGVTGAAVATVVSRYVEAFIMIIWTHTHKEKNIFIVGAYKSMYIPAKLFGNIFVKMLPLMLNETFWSMGMTELNRCYATRGLPVVAATNISSTIANLFSVFYFSIGSAIAIVVGQKLGAGKYTEAKKTAYRMMNFSFLVCILFGILLALFSSVFPQFYNTTEEVRTIASSLILVTAITSPMHSIMNAAYFILRSGGKTLLTMLFDSVYLWVLAVPIAFCLSEFTALTILPIFIIVSSVDIIKVFVGLILVSKGIWIHNIVDEAQPE